MSITFQDNAYLRCFIDHNESYTADAVLDRVQFEDRAPFQIGNVDYEVFKHKYESPAERTVNPLSVTLFESCKALIRVIHHLALAVLIIPNICLSWRTWGAFRIEICLARRELQEFNGRILSLFDNTRGEFHIQESQFHRTCYKNHRWFSRA